MKISSKDLKFLKNVPNSAYESVKTEFLYHSNKIEGSTFTKENLEKYLNENIIEGTHDVDDIYETINSTKLFDFVVNTLDEPISKSLIQEYHRMLKDKTLDHDRGFAGCWKKIPNMISGTDLKLAEPWAVDSCIENLINEWNKTDRSFDDVMKFHAQFEQIHPFQDGNGRVGRFLMFKQCVENDIDLIMIDDEFTNEYKKALNQAQTKNDFNSLSDVFHKCQEHLESKLVFLKETLEYLEVRDTQINSQSM